MGYWQAKLAKVKAELEDARKSVGKGDSIEKRLEAIEFAITTILDCLVRVINALP